MTPTRHLRVICASAILLVAPDARAAVIHLLPPTISVSPGSTVILDLTISDLGGATVGDFDVDIGLVAQSLGSVNPRWSRPDDRDDERGSNAPSVCRGAPSNEFSAHLRWTRCRRRC